MKAEPKLSQEDQEALTAIGQEIVDRSLTAPIIIMLEMGRPLSRIGHQFMIFLDPLVSLIHTWPQYPRVMNLLEDPVNVAWFIDRLEELEAASPQRRLPPVTTSSDNGPGGS